MSGWGRRVGGVGEGVCGGWEESGWGRRGCVCWVAMDLKSGVRFWKMKFIISLFLFDFSSPLAY